MPISSLILYGSCARNEQKNHSDVDLFALTNDPAYRMVIDNKINIASYPTALAHERAKNGDLYILHIIKEGRVIYDKNNGFDSLISAFKYKSNYQEEIKNASDLGWLLIKNVNQTSNFTLFNRRVAWCARTILIAMGAEARQPYFSAHSLAKFSNYKKTEELIKCKSIDHFSESVIVEFARFLEKFGKTQPPEQMDLSETLSYFKKTKNIVGYKTFINLNSGNGLGYC